MMTLKELQQEIDDWITGLKIGYFPVLGNFVRLVEEVGELGRKINTLEGIKPSKPGEDNSKEALADEFGDVLFTLGALANQLGIDLEDAMKRVFEKINRRDVGTRYEKK